MAELLGLGTTDMPFLRGNATMAGVLLNAIRTGKHMREEDKNPDSWPEPMRREWGDDEGLAASKALREHQIPNLQRISAAIADFSPDFIVIWCKDHMESFKTHLLPQYYIGAWDSVRVKPFAAYGSNYFNESPERVVELKGHPQGAKCLIRGLQESGLAPAYSIESMHPNGLAHTHAGAIVHVDWNRREFNTPVVPIGVDPFGPRERGADGLSPLTSDHLYPIAPARAFDVGRVIGRTLRASPYRVALVAATGWSHTQNTDWNKHWVHPHHEGDRRRYQEWKSNRFDKWGENFSYENMEECGQWEHLCWIMLAGAMTEIGAKLAWSDYAEYWAFNQNMVNCIFET